MTEERWTEVDRCLSEWLVPPEAALDAALLASSKAGLPPINVSPNQGKMLELLARAIGARRVLEIGTLGGYSTIWLARGVGEGGRVITLEIDQAYADIARENIDRAELSNRVEVRVGAAADVMRAMVEHRQGPFDLIFIDADKDGYPEYLDLSLELSRAGTLIVADNVVRDGGVIDAKTKDPQIQGVRRFLERVANERRVDATAIQTVGSKGWDGFALLLVTG